jgi:hypothetical protein
VEQDGWRFPASSKFQARARLLVQHTQNSAFSARLHRPLTARPRSHPHHSDAYHDIGTIVLHFQLPVSRNQTNSKWPLPRELPPLRRTSPWAPLSAMVCINYLHICRENGMCGILFCNQSLTRVAGELVFGVARIFASFNDTFVHVTDLRFVSSDLRHPNRDWGFIGSCYDSTNKIQQWPRDHHPCHWWYEGQG